jgi:RNA polymerase sigma-70 factor (ECF subfamily)
MKKGAQSPHDAAQRYFDRGRATWPDVDLEPSKFASYLARHAAASSPPAEVYAADMFLACACAHGIDSALAIFERSLAPEMARAVASVNRSPALVEEAVQATREKLLLRKGGEPAKIADYGGRASLRTWLCAVAVRVALTLLRRKDERGHRSLGADYDARLARGGPEIDYFRGKYKPAFEGAVGRAIGRLSPKDRMLLRLNVIDGMSIDMLAAAYNVGRSTAARWLAAARRSLFDETRDELRKSLHVTSTELDSLSAMLRSQLEVSVLKLLTRASGDED